MSILIQTQAKCIEFSQFQNKKYPNQLLARRSVPLGDSHLLVKAYNENYFFEWQTICSGENSSMCRQILPDIVVEICLDHKFQWPQEGLRISCLRSSLNPPVVIGICDRNKSWARYHRSLKLGLKLKYLNINIYLDFTEAEAHCSSTE